MFSIQNFQVVHCWKNVRKYRCPFSKFYALHTPGFKLQMSKVIARLMARILLSCGLHDAFCTRPTVSPRSPQHYRPVVSNGNRGAIAGKLKHTHTHTSVKLQSEGNADRDTVRVKGVRVGVNTMWPSKFTYLEFWSKPTHSHLGFGFLSIAKKLIQASLEYLLFSHTKVQGCDNISCYLCQ